MNWFERYGITGTYCLLLAVLWAESLYQLPESVSKNPQVLGAFFAAAFLPTGYLVTTIAQFLYLRGTQGRLMTEALRRAGVEFKSPLPDHRTPLAEHILEANSTIRLLRSDADEAKERFIRDWIARRSDVMAINGSLQVATVAAPTLAIVFASLSLIDHFGLELFSQFRSLLIWNRTGLSAAAVLTLASWLLFWFLRASRTILREQTIEVVAAVFRLSAENGKIDLGRARLPPDCSCR